ncbi:MAG: rhomboid family intramembrane serine protease [Deltaproteobacteria bacterium]|nr:rhomboid family intramembrane serine protease [Deltaproteobacteria bacterium]
MILFPIEHQNKIVKKTPFVWILIFIISMISIQTLPKVIQDERTLSALHQEYEKQFYLEAQFYRKYLKETGKNVDFYAIKKTLEWEETTLPLSFEFEDSVLWLLSQKDIAFQETLQRKPAFSSASDYTQWKQNHQDLKNKKKKLFLWNYGFVPSFPRMSGIFTSLFLHGHIFHLFINLFFLWFLGRFIEERYGSANFLLLFFLGGFLSILFHSLTTPFKETPLLGASGAVSALLGAYLVSNFRNKVKLFYFIFPAWFGSFYVSTVTLVIFWGLSQMAGIIESLSSFPISNIGFQAHLGGFLGGILITRLFIDAPLKLKNIEFISHAEKEAFQGGLKFFHAHCTRLALEHFNKALNINPFHPVTQLMVLHLSLKLGQFSPLPSFLRSMVHTIEETYGIRKLALVYERKIATLSYNTPLESSTYLKLANFYQSCKKHELTAYVYMEFLKYYPHSRYSKDIHTRCSKLFKKYFSTSPLEEEFINLIEKYKKEVPYEKEAA